jgi:hypothetical protein
MSTGKADQLAWLIFLLDKKRKFEVYCLAQKTEIQEKL